MAIRGIVMRCTMIMLGAMVVAQISTFAQEKSEQKRSVRRPDTVSGKDIFVEYCASCHGVDGKGEGPVAKALKTPPTDLTTLVKNNEGKYPAGFVSAVLKFGRNLAAHGSQDMPIWGSRFRTMDPSGDPSGQRHVDAVVAYVESLQAK
jgi:mono/diheme cytochrome c family protein